MTGEANREPADPRILFAAERTFLAYVRTGLALMGFGLVVARLPFVLHELSATPAAHRPPSAFSSILGVALVLCGATVCAVSPIWYARAVARLHRGEPYLPPHHNIAVAFGMVLALIGAAIAMCLL